MAGRNGKAHPAVKQAAAIFSSQWFEDEKLTEWIHANIIEGTVLRAWIDYVQQITAAPIAYALGSGLVLLSQSAPHDLAIDAFGRKIHTHVCSLLIGDTGEGKSTVIVRVQELLMQQNSLIVSTPFTVPDLESSIQAAPRLTLIYTNFGTLLAASRRNSPNAHLRERMAELSDGGPIIITTRNGARVDRQSIDNVEISILGGVAPVTLDELVTTTDVDSGLLARFLVFGGRRTADAMDYDTMPIGRVANSSDHITTLLHTYMNRNITTCAGLTPIAEQWLKMALTTVSSNGVKRGAVDRRTATWILKIALMLAHDRGVSARATWYLDETDIIRAASIINVARRNYQTLITDRCETQLQRRRRFILTLCAERPRSAAELIRELGVLKREWMAIQETLIADGSLAPTGSTPEYFIATASATAALKVEEDLSIHDEPSVNPVTHTSLDIDF